MFYHVMQKHRGVRNKQKKQYFFQRKVKYADAQHKIFIKTPHTQSGVKHVESDKKHRYQCNGGQ